MGVTFTTKTDRFASMSCSGFNDLRRYIGIALNYPIKEIQFNDYKSKIVDLDYSSFSASNYKGIWNTEPSDPMYCLFVHSDYDGNFEPKNIGPMIPLLEKARLWFESQEGMFKLIYLKQFDELFEGFKRAYTNNETVSLH